MRPDRSGKRYSHCYECQKRYRREHYRRVPGPYIERAKLRTQEFRRRVYQYLSEHPCVDCGETDPIVLEFDHEPGNKVDIISRMVQQRAWNATLAEIAKCSVRCANCHRRKTAERAGWYAYIRPLG